MNIINFLAETGVNCNDVEIGGNIVKIIRVLYNGIKIGVPIILIVVGMIGMGKAIASQKEDDIKKAQSTLIKQAVAALIVFLMFQLVQILMSVANFKNTSYWNCAAVILNGNPTAGDTCYVKDEESPAGKWQESTSTGDKYWKCVATPAASTYTSRSACEGAGYTWYVPGCYDAGNTYLSGVPEASCNSSHGGHWISTAQCG